MRKGFAKTLLALVLCCVFAFCGCGGKGGDENNPNPTPEPGTPSTPSYNAVPDYAGGIHEFKKTATSDKFVTDGETEYIIVYPDNVTARENFAVSELTYLFHEATGSNIEAFSEGVKPNDVPYISVGDTELADEAGVEKDEELNSHGYVIRTVDNNFYIRGTSDYGTMWGAYEFLTQTMGYEGIGYEAFGFTEDCRNVPVYDLEVRDQPDVRWRTANWGPMYNDSSKARRLRMSIPTEIYLNGPSYPHNYFVYVPKSEENLTLHPGWFSDDGEQLCLTAHGDPDEYAELKQTVVNKMKEYILSDPDMEIVNFDQQDADAWCTCDACKAIINKNGGASVATAIMFVNDVADTIKEWLDSTQGGRKIYITLFAYLNTELPPVNKNEDGTYTPTSPEMICRDNVTIWYAPIWANFMYGFNEPENLTQQEVISGWTACTKNFSYWGYCANFSAYNVMQNCFTATQDTYKYIFNRMNPILIFDEGDYQGESSGFTHFKAYLQSQWSWDVNRDYDMLKEKFFGIAYGPAKEFMEKFYDEYRLQCFVLEKTEGWGGGFSTGVPRASYFPYRMVMRWMDYIDQAYAAIEPLKATDPMQYQEYNDAIRLESVSARYLLAKLHLGRLQPDEADALTAGLNADYRYFGISYDGEHAPLY